MKCNPKNPSYYVPPQSHWPLMGSIALVLIAIGIGNILHAKTYGVPVLIAGLLAFVITLFGWFRNVIHESLSGLYNAQMDRSFRWSMLWFIFSEIMFFSAFFGALLYIRHFSLPWLSGSGDKGISHLLWENFQFNWPLLQTPNPDLFPNVKSAVNAWGLPFINTLILLSSGATITWAHCALEANQRRSMLLGLFLTFSLGFVFLGLQTYEYHHAYTHLDLKLSHGIYASLFYLLTGFHGLHVFLGSLILFIIWLRALQQHFKPGQSFAFEAATWYWHFVDVIWLLLFVLVY